MSRRPQALTYLTGSESGTGTQLENSPNRHLFTLCTIHSQKSERLLKGLFAGAHHLRVVKRNGVTLPTLHLIIKRPQTRSPIVSAFVE